MQERRRKSQRKSQSQRQEESKDKSKEESKEKVSVGAGSCPALINSNKFRIEEGRIKRKVKRKVKGRKSQKKSQIQKIRGRLVASYIIFNNIKNIMKSNLLPAN